MVTALTVPVGVFVELDGAENCFFDQGLLVINVNEVFVKVCAQRVGNDTYNYIYSIQYLYREF